MSIKRLAVAVIFLLPAGVWGCGEGGEEAALELETVWARPMLVTPGAGSQGVNSAVYLRIRNRGREEDRLLGGATRVATRVEVHESYLEGDVMRMRRLEGIQVPPAGEVALRPGGLHVMLLGLKESLVEGESFPMVLEFEVSGEVEVEVSVGDPGEGIG